jgi:hypothetical protein
MRAKLPVKNWSSGVTWTVRRKLIDSGCSACAFRGEGEPDCAEANKVNVKSEITTINRFGTLRQRFDGEPALSGLTLSSSRIDRVFDDI